MFRAIGDEPGELPLGELRGDRPVPRSPRRCRRRCGAGARPARSVDDRTDAGRARRPAGRSPGVAAAPRGGPRRAPAQAVQAARRIDDTGALAAQLESLGELQLLAGRYEESLRAYYEAADLHRKRNDLPSRYRAILQLGLVYRHIGRWSEADASLGEALELCRRTGDLVRSPTSRPAWRQPSWACAATATPPASRRRRPPATASTATPSAPDGRWRPWARPRRGWGVKTTRAAASRTRSALLDPVDEVGAGAVRSLLGR